MTNKSDESEMIVHSPRQFSFNFVWMMTLLGIALGCLTVRAVLWINGQEVSAAQPPEPKLMQAKPVGEFSGYSDKVNLITIDGVRYLIVEGRGTAIIKHEPEGE